MTTSELSDFLSSYPWQQLLTSALILIVVIAGRRVALRVHSKRSKDLRSRYLWEQASMYLAVAVFLVAFERIWLDWFTSWAALGLVSAGIAVAMKEPLTNLAGWVFILWRRPFQLGDRVQIGEHKGDVVEVRLFQFSIVEVGNWVDADQLTGRVLHVPNGQVFVSVLANYSRGLGQLWNELPVQVTFESDWEKAKELLTQIVTKKAEEWAGITSELPGGRQRGVTLLHVPDAPSVHTRVADSGVLLTVRYACETRRRRETESELWEAVLREFKKHNNIDFAYPTQRFYDNRHEGKPEARAPLDGK